MSKWGARLSACTRNCGMESLSGKRRKIAGDTTKLPFAVGLSPLERRVLNHCNLMAGSVPGAREVRHQIGHIIFAARILYGQGLLYTVSPSDRHCGLMLKISRFRTGDPGIVHDEDGMASWIGAGQPCLETPTVIELPEYDVRRAILSRAPLAVVEGFMVTVRVLLAKLLGIWTCPHCPKCNANGKPFPCQDKFGSNAGPEGGVLGRVDAT
eukprot:12063936-Heterocapsa_arctica.AAC.1